MAKPDSCVIKTIIHFTPRHEVQWIRNVINLTQSGVLILEAQFISIFCNYTNGCTQLHVKNLNDGQLMVINSSSDVNLCIKTCSTPPWLFT